MVSISNSLNAHNLPIFQPILMILASKFMVHGALSDRTYLVLGLLSPLSRFRILQKARHLTISLIRNLCQDFLKQ